VLYMEVDVEGRASESRQRLGVRYFCNVNSVFSRVLGFFKLDQLTALAAAIGDEARVVELVVELGEHGCFWDMIWGGRGARGGDVSPAHQYHQVAELSSSEKKVAAINPLFTVNSPYLEL
jgi:hypothetical protein